MYKLYDFLPSGNCYKIRLLLNQLGIEYERVSVDILKRSLALQNFLKLTLTVERLSCIMMESILQNPMPSYGFGFKYSLFTYR